MKLAFIGGGNMGEAILAALLREKRVIPAGVTMSDISPERRDYLAKTYGITATDSNRDAVENKDVVLLAVKPQQFPEVLAGLKGYLNEDSLVISIAAGVKLHTIVEGLGHARVVRAMPNTPAQVGQGVTGWTATPQVTEKQKEQAGVILGSMGYEKFFEKEDMLDMVTAVSGSGPAYVFLFTETLAAAAQELGFGPEEASEFALKTVTGAARLLETSGKSPAELRRAVTSRGGTTERALKTFDEGGLAALVAKAVKSAWERSRELGG